MKFANLLPLVLLPLTASAKAPDLKTVLEAKYVAITNDFKSHNADAYAKMLSADFVVQPPKGPSLDKAHMVADFKRQSMAMSGVTWTRHITKLTHAGKDVDVIVDGHFIGAFKGGDGKEHHFDLHSTTDDLWTPQGSDWLLKRSHATKLDAVVDGKKMGG